MIPEKCQCDGPGYCSLMKRPSCDPPEGRLMSGVRWSECSNQDGQHAAWFEMLLNEATLGRCPGRPASKTAEVLGRTAIEGKIGEGPGTEMMLILATRVFKWLAAPTSGCKCWNHAKTMNDNGAEWCSRETERIVGWLKEEYGKRKVPIVFVPAFARQLVKLAIRRSVRRCSK